MSILSKFNKPEYIYSPKRLWKRMTSSLPQSESAMVELPWRRKLWINPLETIGRSIYVLGVYDLPLSECIWRTLPLVDTFVDVGANIGYFASMAIGQEKFKGQIHAFEPNPDLHSKIVQNLGEDSRLSIHSVALGKEAGQGRLYLPHPKEENDGVASFKRNTGSRFVDVPIQRLDGQKFLGQKMMLKIDTEGFETEVLEGARLFFEEGRVQAVFFEEFEIPAKASSIKWLTDMGYLVKRIQRGFFGPVLKDLTTPIQGRIWEPLNYVASKQNSEIWDLLANRGWTLFTDN